MNHTDQRWPVFVLSLVGDEARRAPLLRSLEALGINHELVLGIDGRRGIPVEYEKMVDRAEARRRHGRNLTDGEIACALSHRAIYEKIVCSGVPGAIILEDDSIVNARLLDFLNSRIYERAELVMLDHSHARVHRSGKSVMQGVSIMRLRLIAHRTNAYSVSTSAAKWLLRESTPLRDQADWPADITLIGATVLSPPIVNHPVEESGISHLDQGRKASIPRQSSLHRSLSRLVKLSFWRRWIIKRIAKRVS